MTQSTSFQVSASSPLFTAGVFCMALDALSLAISLTLYFRYRARHMLALALVCVLQVVNWRLISAVIDQSAARPPGGTRPANEVALDMVGNAVTLLHVAAFTSMNAHRLYNVCYSAFPRLVIVMLALAAINVLFRFANSIQFFVELATMRPIDLQGPAVVTMQAWNIFDALSNGSISVLFIAYLQTLYDSTSAPNHILVREGITTLLRRSQILLGLEVTAMVVASCVTQAFPWVDPFWIGIQYTVSFRTLAYCYFLSSLTTIMQSIVVPDELNKVPDGTGNTWSAAYGIPTIVLMTVIIKSKPGKFLRPTSHIFTQNYHINIINESSTSLCVYMAQKPLESMQCAAFFYVNQTPKDQKVRVSLPRSGGCYLTIVPADNVRARACFNHFIPDGSTVFVTDWTNDSSSKPGTLPPYSKN